MNRLLMLAGLGLVAARCLSQDITELTIQERSGVGRQNEPIRIGVPFGKGVVQDVGDLVLRDASGQIIPVQCKEVMRWPDDNSLRWVLLNFQASVPAKGRQVVKLAKGKAAAAGKLDANVAAGAVTVNNGVLKIVFKGENLIDAAWHDPAGKFGPDTQIIQSHTDGLIARINGKVLRASPDSKVTVEEQGSEAVVVKIAGKLMAGDLAPYEYVCYAHVFRGSPVVRLDVAYTCVFGKDAVEFVNMEDWSLVLPTTLDGGMARVGGADRVFNGKSVKIAAKSSDLSEIEVDGKKAGTAPGKSAKPATIGWVGLSRDGKGLAVGVRWFWQMFPKAMEVAADGKLRAGFYAAEMGAPLEVYMGQGRTHYATLLFGSKPDRELADFFAGSQQPLRALCTPKYYCRDSEGFGKVADSDPSIYAPDVADRMKLFDICLSNSAKAIERKIDGFTYNGVSMDSYGYNPWGDLFHHANAAGVADKWNILWESNYYDFPWACGLQFARTGDLLYLDILERNGLHLGDVFMCKYAPDRKYCGACRYSPPANHVGLDTDWQAPKPYFSVEFNHHKAQSILARYYLLGDLRARDDFLLALNNAMTNPEASWRQCRGPGAKLATLYSGYLLTRDPKCLDKMRECMAGALKLKDTPQGFSKQGKSGYFMMGIATEGMYYYWLLTGDKDTLATIKNVSDFQIGEARNASVANSSCAIAFLYRQTGDDKYKQAALDFLKPKEEMRPKNFGSHWRNAAYAWYYLSNAGTDKK
jgi:hypothetical protein